jgi:hypothetical protein
MPSHHHLNVAHELLGPHNAALSFVNQLEESKREMGIHTKTQPEKWGLTLLNLL